MSLVPTILYGSYPFAYSNVIFSNGYLTGTVNGGNQGSCRSSRPAGGKVYWEVVTNVLYTGDIRVGIASGAANQTNFNYSIGQDNFSLGYDQNGNVYLNNSVLKTIAAWSPGATICCALDPVAGLIWFNVNGGTWNNDVLANQNPVGDIGGISYSTSYMGGSIWASVGGYGQSSWTMSFADSSWAYTPPSGYVGFSDIVIVSEHAGKTALKAHGLTVVSPSQRPIPKPKTIGFTAGNAGSPLGAAVSVSGTVQQNGTNVAKYVAVYDTITRKLLEIIKSDPSTGDFNLLAHSRNSVFVVAWDPTAYQAQVYDNITPA